MVRSQIWAHRGARKERPENSLDAFRRALELGADGFELDVQRTADGKLVVIHDESLDRVSWRPGRVAELTWEELKRYNIAAFRTAEGFPPMQVPLLEEVLALLQGRKCCCNIELKNSVEAYPGMEDEVISLVSRMGLTEQIVYSSFSRESVALLAQKADPAAVGLLYDGELHEPVKVIQDLGGRALHPEKSLLSEAYVAEAHRAGIKVNVWTVNDEDALLRLAHYGADSLITDDPALALSLRNQF